VPSPVDPGSPAPLPALCVWLMLVLDSSLLAAGPAGSNTICRGPPSPTMTQRHNASPAIRLRPDGKAGPVSILLTPPAIRALPDGLLRIAWGGLMNGEKPRATVTDHGQVLYEFEGHTPATGFRQAGAENDWFCDLSRLPAAADKVHLRVQPLSVCTIRVTVGVVRSVEDTYEHAGVEVEAGADAYVVSFEREGKNWQLRALAGHLVSGTARDGVARAGKSILAVVDGSASMLRWFDSGAVVRLIAALQEDAARAGVGTLRLAFTGSRPVQVRSLSVNDDAAELVRKQLTERGLYTQADVVGTATRVLAPAAAAETVTVLVTDCLPAASVDELLSASNCAVVAMVGVSDPSGLSEPDQLAELRQRGLGVGLLGEVHQSRSLIIDALSNAIRVTG
jgi:hypothetical protein